MSRLLLQTDKAALLEFIQLIIVTAGNLIRSASRSMKVFVPPVYKTISVLRSVLYKKRKPASNTTEVGFKALEFCGELPVTVQS